MRTMVIGGAGFIGSHLVDRLLAEQHGVDVVDDLSSGSLANLAQARAFGGELKIHHLDACADEFGSLVSMREPDVIYHLGCMPPGRGSPAVMARAVQSTLQVLDAARSVGQVKVVTGVPAGALYGDVPARELPVKEGRPYQPVGVAGAIAQTIVELLAVHRRQDATEFTALALTSVYGPRQRADGGVVAAFHAAHRSRTSPTMVGDGRQSRDFVFVDDVVDAFVRAGQRGSGLVVNIGTGVLTSIRELWAAMAGPAGAKPFFTPAPVEHLGRFAVSPTRARIHLSWAPWTTLDQGLRQLDAA